MFESQECWGDRGEWSGSKRILESIWHARKPGTIRLYCYALRKFFEHGVLCGRDLVLPIDSVSACAYVSYLRDSGASCGAVKVAYNAMKWAHNFVPGILAFNDPLDEKIVKRVFESALRAIQPNRNPKTPLSKEVIDRIFSQLHNASSLTECRDALVVTLAFALLLRHDEVSHLSCAHLERVGKNVRVKISSSKTDSLNIGRDMWLAEGKTTRLLDRYLFKAGLSFGMNHFLFGPIDPRGPGKGVKNEKLAYHTFRKILRTQLEGQGVDPVGFGFHSCRSGGATELAQNATPYELMAQGRWKDQRSLAHYVEIPVQRRVQLSQLLSK